MENKKAVKVAKKISHPIPPKPVFRSFFFGLFFRPIHVAKWKALLSSDLSRLPYPMMDDVPFFAENPKRGKGIGKKIHDRTQSCSVIAWKKGRVAPLELPARNMVR